MSGAPSVFEPSWLESSFSRGRLGGTDLVAGVCAERASPNNDVSQFGHRVLYKLTKIGHVWLPRLLIDRLAAGQGCFLVIQHAARYKEVYSPIITR